MTLKKRGNKWYCRVRLHGVSVSRTFVLKADAEAWGRQTEAEIERGTYQPYTEARRTRLCAILDEYERRVLPAQRSASRGRSVLKMLRRELGNLTLASIEARHVVALRDSRLDAGKAPGTVIKDLNTLSAIIEWVIKDRCIELPRGNVCKLVRRPRANQARDRRLQPGEETTLLAAARTVHPLLEPAIVLAIETGMRQGEILELEWPRIDLANGVIKLQNGTTKNGQGREVPLSLRAMSALRSMPRHISTTRVFTTWNTRLALWYQWRDALSLAAKQLPGAGENLHFHDLRHEAASRLAPCFSAHELAAILGHKTLNMVMRYYRPTGAELAKKLPDRQGQVQVA